MYGQMQQERERVREEGERRENVGEEKKKKKDQSARRSKNERCVFSRFGRSGRSKSRLATAAGAERSGGMRHENCTRLGREAELETRT